MDESQPLPSHLPPEATARHLLQRCADLCSPPRKLLLRLLAEHAAEPQERATLLRWASVAGREEAQREVTASHSTVLDVLERFPSARPPFAAILDALPPLQPRLYSAASAPGASSRVAVALSLVEVPTPKGGLRPGVGSAFVARRARELWAQSAEASCEEEMSSSPASSPGSASSWTRVEAGGEGGGSPPPRPALRVFLRPGGDFRPGEDPQTPIVMVGPGTGVAPFVGFLQDRQNRLALGQVVGESWLFFGCRHPDHDYLYRDELESFARSGALTHLRVAFSRAQSRKVYVQHLMAEHRRALFDVLARRGGRVYVCGDGAAMARDVHAEIVALHRECGGLSDAEAAAAVAELVEERRYLRDIWS
ncbi:hypothetical protein H632_c2756p1 [Helicosporidium sp. ATCC 50920]|nr:hypothetical protein H632_c2756p1 [Helicosporidium sp. ATCC 50920]|eukprot:KDD72903.1 hypothetical protein H632_c2756p1 [Helicosporidium sp. ATCC 50920]